MRFNQEDVLVMLKESDRNGWNVRKMANLRKEGFLTPLKRGVQPGTNSPDNFWDETDVEQVFDVYDWWDYCDGDRATLALVLWLDGYEVPLHLLRNIYIPTIENHLKNLTGGNTDPDDILDKVSEIVVRWIRKLMYTPGLADQRKKMKIEQNVSMQQLGMLTEVVLGTLAVPDQESTINPFQSILLSTTESQEVSIDLADEEEFSARYQHVAAIMREIFSLPNMLDVINSATLEQWDQALEDYGSIVTLLKEIGNVSTKGDTSVFDGTLVRNLIIMGAVWLIAPLLSIRYRRYGQWIDMAFEKTHEFLSDPAAQEQVINMQKARRKMVSAIANSENKQ